MKLAKHVGLEVLQPGLGIRDGQPDHGGGVKVQLGDDLPYGHSEFGMRPKCSQKTRQPHFSGDFNGSR